MFSVTNLLCDYQAGNEHLRYGHRTASGEAEAIPRPVVVWAVTKACNLRCVHCYASATNTPAPNELTYAEGLALLNDLAAFHVPAVLFSGGEPLSRPEILPFIRHARSLGLACTLSTNGLLIDDKMADNLAQAGLKYAGISIDGMEARHDQLRGKIGAFKGTLGGMRRCRERGIKVGARFTVHGLNVDDLDAIFDLCVANEVQRLCIYHLAYAGRADNMQKVDLTAGQIRAVVDRIFQKSQELHAQGIPLEVLTVDNHADAAYLLLQLEKNDPQQYQAVRTRLEGTGGNRSGCNIASVDPVGHVHYDQFTWNYHCGNIREKPFSQIWTEASDPRLAILRNRKAYLPARCQACRFLSVCNGNLRTRAEAATGDWLGFDPACYLTDAEIGINSDQSARTYSLI
ncbi:MAG: radical SAM protein [Phycisphaerae bacterium]